MQKETLKFISDALASAGIPYEFDEFNSSIESLDRYWVGEYQETEPLTEDGLEEATFILTGYAKEDMLILENDKKTIKQLFPPISGNRAILDNGSGVAIFYTDAFPVPTGDDFIKKIQININIKEWMVN